MMHTYRGNIAVFHPKRGRGRIACDDGGLLSVNRRACDFEPRVGDRVHFHVTADSAGKLCAADVRLE
jgi:hypothetical protein